MGTQLNTIALFTGSASHAMDKENGVTMFIAVAYTSILMLHPSLINMYTSQLELMLYVPFTPVGCQVSLSGVVVYIHKLQSGLRPVRIVFKRNLTGIATMLSIQLWAFFKTHLVPWKSHYHTLQTLCTVNVIAHTRIINHIWNAIIYCWLWWEITIRRSIPL